jgi:hypothetical protein
MIRILWIKFIDFLESIEINQKHIYSIYHHIFEAIFIIDPYYLMLEKKPKALND